MQKREKYGFVYLWYDKRDKRYYLGSHWGRTDDAYICSSDEMKNEYQLRPQDFKRRILKKITTSRKELLSEEYRWLRFITYEELGVKYYNKGMYGKFHWAADPILRAEVSERMKGNKNGAVPCSPEKAKNISEAKQKKFARRLAETGQNYDDNTLERMRKATQDAARPHTQEWKDENSKRLKKQWNEGIRDKETLSNRMKENNPLFNKEIRQKVSKANSKPLPSNHKAKAIGGSRTEKQKAASNKCKSDLKNRWADPVWASNQRARLKEGQQRRRITEKEQPPTETVVS